MRQVKVWRYYCDHCKKGGCGKAAMAKHEKRCVKNPARECGMCAICGDASAPMAELTTAAKESLDAIREASNNCPACMLAGIVQAELADDHECRFFDFKSESAEFWKNYNSGKDEQEWPY